MCYYYCHHRRRSCRLQCHRIPSWWRQLPVPSRFRLHPRRFHLPACRDAPVAVVSSAHRRWQVGEQASLFPAPESHQKPRPVRRALSTAGGSPRCSSWTILETRQLRFCWWRRLVLFLVAFQSLSFYCSCCWVWCTTPGHLHCPLVCRCHYRCPDLADTALLLPLYRRYSSCFSCGYFGPLLRAVCSPGQAKNRAIYVAFISAVCPCLSRCVGLYSSRMESLKRQSAQVSLRNQREVKEY